MFYRQHKTFWYQFCNLKQFLKAGNSEDIFTGSCEQNSVTCHVTQSETELLNSTCILRIGMTHELRISYRAVHKILQTKVTISVK